MKKIYGLFITGILIGLTTQANAQTWLTSGSNIYYNLGNVGIGTTSPSGHLSIYKAGGATFSMQDGTNSRFWFMASGNALQLGGDGSTSPTSGAISILNNGNVGIGTTSPSAKFHVYGEAGSGHILRFESGTAYQGLKVYGESGSGNGKIVLQPTTTPGSGISAQYTHFKNSVGGGTTNHGVLVDGYLGVGTTAPQGQFHVSATGNTRTYLTAGSSSIAQINFGDSGDTNAGRIDYLNSDNSLRFVTGDVYTMTIQSGGNVGIGTTSPTAKLHVLGQGVDFLSYTADNRLNFGRNPNEKFSFYATDNHGYLDYIQDSDDNGDHILFVRNIAQGTSANNDIRFQTSSADRVTIKDNGNVGIGTTTPDQKLTVAGTVKSQEVIVEETAGADFVFEDDYDLPTLAQIEQFIKANKHLEGIASAEEMKANGVKVGELQIKLLQKIEELTLHTIKQQKLIQLQAEALAIVQRELKEIKEKK